MPTDVIDHWFYDFEYLRDLSEDEFNTLLDKFSERVSDPSGTGWRVQVDQYKEKSPLFLSSIFVVLYTLEQKNGLFPTVANQRSDNNDQWLSLDSRRFRKNNIFNKRNDGLISPCESIQLTEEFTGEFTGKGCIIAVIDSGFNYCVEDLPVLDRINLSQEDRFAEEGNSHGSNCLSVISGTNYSIAPKAQILLVRITPSNEESIKTCTPAAAIVGLLWAATKNADIISISYSLSRKKNSDVKISLQRAIDYCGSRSTLVVTTTENNVSVGVSAIAASMSENIVAVNGITNFGFPIYNASDDRGAIFHCAAPGQNIRAYNDLCDLNSVTEGFGVSISVPIVAAALALHKQAKQVSFIELKKDFLKNRCKTPLNLNNEQKKFFGHGAVSFK